MTNDGWRMTDKKRRWNKEKEEGEEKKSLR